MSRKHTLPSVLLAFSLLVALAFSAFAQMFGFSALSDGTTLTITINPSSTLGTVRRFTGAPYSGQQTSETVQTLPDGTHLTRPAAAGPITYRDSMGRIRTEHMFGGPASGPRPINFTLIEIDDLVAGYRYVIDSVNQVAHRVQRTPATPVPPSVPPVSGSQTHTTPDGDIIASEPLGTSTMLGLAVVGRKTTTTYPAGSQLGNDRTVTGTNESWWSPQLGIVVSSTSTRPGSGVTTMTMKNLSTAEPDPALFRIPPGYKIIDEAGSFTIKIAR